MSSQRRTTRSAKANIPDIPLPPRREAAKKTGKAKSSAKINKTSTTLSKSPAFSNNDTSRHTSNEDLHPEPAKDDIHPNANPEPSTTDNATAVASNNILAASVRLKQPNFPPSASKPSSAESVNALIQKPDVPSRMRPRPVPITSANRKIQSTDDMFILSNRFRFKKAPPPPQPASVNSIGVEDPPSTKAAPKVNKQKTFVNAMGISIDYDDSSDAEDLRTYQRRPTAQRSPTPGVASEELDPADEDDEDEDGGEEQLGHQGEESHDEDDNSPNPQDGEDDNVHRDDDDNYNHVGSGFEDEDKPEELIESDISQSDFEETTAEWKRKRREKANVTCRSLTPTMSEQDEEDEKAFDEEVAKDTSLSPPRIPASRKGKGRASDVASHCPESEDEDGPEANPGVEDTETDDNPDEDAEPGISSRYSSGPISNEDKDAAFEAHAEMIEKLDKIAKRCNKPLKHFLAMVGQYAKPPRALSSWEVYQPWYSACVKKKPADVTIQLWTKVEVSVAYNKKLKVLHDKLGTTKPRREEIEEHFKEQFDFYRGIIKNYITAKKDSKKFAAVVSKVVEPFVRMSTQVSEELGIHIFGFAIETTPDSCSSVAWGGSHEYKVLRDQHKTVLQTQLHDYEGMFKVAEMQGRANPASKHTFFVDIRKKDKESERDYLRRILGEFLRSDLARIFSERDKSSDESSHATKAKMTWSWTDNAYDKDLRIINWEKNVAFPKNQFDPKKISHDTLKKMVKPRITWYQRRLEAANHDSSDDMDVDLEEEFSKLVQIVSWTQEERTRELKDKHSIPLVIDVAGHTLLKVFDSDRYIASMKNIGASIQRSRTSEHADDVESDSTQCLQEQSGSIPSSRNAATQKQQKRKRKRDKPAFVEVDSESEDTATAERGRTLRRPKPTSSRMLDVRTTPSTESTHSRSRDRNSTAASKSRPEPATNPNSCSNISPSVFHPNAQARSGSARHPHAQSRSQSRSHPSSSKPSDSRHVQSRSPSAPPSHPSGLPSATRPNNGLPAVSPAHQRMTAAGRASSTQVDDPSFESGQNHDSACNKPPGAMAGNSAKTQQRQLYPEPRRPMVSVENRDNAEPEGRRKSSASRHEGPGLQPQQGVQRSFDTQVDSGDERSHKRRRIESENSPPFPLPNGHYYNPEPSHFPQMRMGPTNYVDRRDEYIDHQRNHHFNTQRNDYMDQRPQEHNYPHSHYRDQSDHRQVSQDYFPPPPRPDPSRYPTQSSYTRYDARYPQDRNATPGPSYHQYDHSGYRNHEYYK